MKLISMTEFTLNLFKNLDDVSYRKDLADYVNKTHKYARFINQPLTLGMFIACDEDENALEEPEFHEPNNENEIGDYDELRYQYQQAKDKVIFDGFSIGGTNLITNTKLDFWYDDFGVFELDEEHTKLETVEDLVKHNLTITPNAIKQLKL